jgi:hypothetical protein
MHAKIDLMFDNDGISGEQAAALLRRLARDIEAYSAEDLVGYRGSVSTADGVARAAFFAGEDSEED